MATIGALIYKIGLDLSELVTNVQQASTKLDNLAGVATKVGGAFGIALSGAAVVGYTRTLLDSADATVKLADKTGMTIDAVQRLGYAAGQQGNTLDQVSGAVSQLQKRLGGDEKSALTAIRDLGIVQAEFMRAAPDQQFLQIARAVATIHDPLTRARIATDLFGRAGTEMLPMMIADLDALASRAPVMSERAVKALDDAGDAIAGARLKLQVLASDGLLTIMEAAARFNASVPDWVRSLALFTAAIWALNTALASTAAAGVLSLIRALGGLVMAIHGVGMAVVGGSLSGLGAALTVAISPALALSAAIAGVGAAAYASYLAYEAWKANAEAARAKSQTAAIAQTVLARASQLAGHEITNQAEAMRILDAESARLRKQTTGFGDDVRALIHRTVEANAALGTVFGSGLPDDSAKQAEELAREIEKATQRANAFRKAVEDATGMSVWRQAIETMAVLGAAGEAVDPTKFAELARQVVAGVDAADRLGLAVDDAARVIWLLMKEPPNPATLVANFDEVGKQLDALVFKGGQFRGLFAKPLPTMFAPLPQVPQGGSFAQAGLSLGTDFLGSTGVIAKNAGAILKGQWSTVGSAVGSQLGTNVVSKFGASITGLLGNTIGGVVNSFIPAIGSMLGPLISAIGKLFDHSAGNAQRAANAYGITLSESLSKGIIDDSKGLFGGNFQAATIYNLSKLIDEAGGITASSFGKWGKAANDIFSMVQTGKFTADQAAKAFDPVFSKLAAHLTETGGLADEQFRQLIARVDEFGVKSQAVTAFVKGGVATASSAFVTYLGQVASTHEAVVSGQTELADLQKRLAGDVSATERAELTKRATALQAAIDTQQTLLTAVGLSSQSSASAFSDALWGMYDGLLKQGLSVTDALTQMGPAVSALEAELTRTGYGGGEAFGVLQRMVALTKDDLAGPALSAVQGLGSGLTALYNTGILNESMFTGLAGQVAHTFDTLIASGKPTEDVLRVMQPQLQTIWKLWQDQGWAIDDATQNLLAQAEAQGLVGKAQQTSEEKMLDGIDRIASATERLADVFAGRLPDAMARGAQAMVGEAERIGAALDAAVNIPRTAKVQIDWPDDAVVTAATAAGGSYHTGGVVSAARRAVSSAPVPTWAPRFHAGGEVPAWLQSGEFVVSRQGVQAIGLATLAAANADRGTRGGGRSGESSGSDTSTPWLPVIVTMEAEPVAEALVKLSRRKGW